MVEGEHHATVLAVLSRPGLHPTSRLMSRSRPKMIQEHSGAGPGVHRSKSPGLASVRLFVVVAVLGGLPPLEPPVNFVGGRVPPLQHPVLEAR